jgi:uridylate kinase
MANGREREKVVISLGGSIICPGVTPELYDYSYIDELVSFIGDQVKDDPKKLFFLVTGGGALARLLQGAGRERKRPLTDLQKDWLGIHATRSNAQVLKTEAETLREGITHSHIIKHYEIIRRIETHEQIVCAAGWKPGRSTDYCAVQLCEDYHAPEVINLTNIPKVYTADPKKDHDAKPLDEITWTQYREQVLGEGVKWSPGLNTPFDPIASELAQRIGIRVAIMDGHDLKNLENYLDGKPFVGTVIEGD